VRLLGIRLAAVGCALTWLVFPGFGLIDLGVTWNPDWPVVLEGGWGLFTTVLIGGSFLAVALRPRRSAPALVTLLVALGTMLVSAAAGLEWQLLGYAGVLAVEAAGIWALLRRVPDGEPLRPAPWSVRPPLLFIAALGVVPWVIYAAGQYRSNRANLGVALSDVTMGVDHYAVQGALALALAALAVLASCWPRGRRFTGIAVGVCAGYLGLVSLAFPHTWAGVGAVWSALTIAWGLALIGLSVVPVRLQQGELGGEVVEAQRAL
jgi:hypothetical protein